MAERFTADLLFIVIVLLIAALLGFLIGFFIERSRRKKEVAILNDEIDGLKADIKRLEEEKNALNARIEGLVQERQTLLTDIAGKDLELASLKLKVSELENIMAEDIPQESRKMATPSTERFEQDDLKVVVGIGPKIAHLLKNRGITGWRQLAETSPDHLREILLSDGGENYRIHNPDSWPHQAKLLNEAKWDEFRELRQKMEGE